MTTLACREFTVTDQAGNAIAGASIAVYAETSGAPLAQLYSDRAGTVPIANPFAADSNGFAQFFTTGGAYKIIGFTGPIGAPTFSQTWRYVPIGTAAEFDAGVSVVVETDVNFAMSPYAVQLGDTVLYVDTSGGAVVIDLPLAAARNGRAITIKDVTGNAATAGHNVSIVPSGSETIETLNPLPINANYGGFRLYPATGKYVIAP